MQLAFYGYLLSVWMQDRKQKVLKMFYIISKQLFLKVIFINKLLNTKKLFWIFVYSHFLLQLLSF